VWESPTKVKKALMVAQGLGEFRGEGTPVGLAPVGMDIGTSPASAI